MNAQKTSLVALLLAVAVGCGGASNSEVRRPDAGTGSGTGGGGTATGTGGTTGGTGSGGATTGTGGATTGTGGATTGSGGATTGSGGATTGSGGATGSGGSTGSCPARTSVTLAQRMALDATWSGTTGTSAGTGKIYLWNLAKLNANGKVLSGETRSCGTVLPDFMLTALGQIAAGGSKVNVEVPHKVWDTPSIPKFVASGTLEGWEAGSKFSIDGTVALVGLTMPDPRAAWPASYTSLTPVDADGDGKPGITAIPKAGSGYVMPPTAIGIGGSAPQAENVYIASRRIIALSGMLTSCTDISGTAQAMFFDSHVVGCKIKGGADCDAKQTDFVDQNRTAYKISGGSFVAKQIADNATCADVRTALPM